jgi:hypothetical protein
MAMTHDEAAEVLTAALRLKRERVTGSLDEKAGTRAALSEAISMMTAVPVRPTAEHLRELLGEFDGPRVREALAAWQ